MTQRPKKTGGDVAHAVVRAGLSSVPIVGGAGAELFNYLIAPPLEKRRDEWIESIAEGLKELEKKDGGFSIESLIDNPEFTSTVLHASQAAIRSHQQEKLEALRNAVLNVAVGNSPYEDLQLMFLNFVDTFTTWHLRILKFLGDPNAGAADSSMKSMTIGGINGLIESIFPDLKGKREFYDLIGDDLNARALIRVDGGGFHTMTTSSGVFVKTTTEIGDHFLKFISNPI